jgi:hypothetical protein
VSPTPKVPNRTGGSGASATCAREERQRQKMAGSGIPFQLYPSPARLASREESTQRHHLLRAWCSKSGATPYSPKERFQTRNGFIRAVIRCITLALTEACPARQICVVPVRTDICCNEVATSPQAGRSESFAASRLQSESAFNIPVRRPRAAGLKAEDDGIVGRRCPCYACS